MRRPVNAWARPQGWPPPSCSSQSPTANRPDQPDGRAEASRLSQGACDFHDPEGVRHAGWGAAHCLPRRACPGHAGHARTSTQDHAAVFVPGTGTGHGRRKAVICLAQRLQWCHSWTERRTLRRSGSSCPGSGDLICGLDPGGRAPAPPHNAAMAATEGGFRGTGNWRPAAAAARPAPNHRGVH